MMGSALALRRLLSDSVRIFSQPMQLARILDQMEALNCDRDGDIPAPEPVVVAVGCTVQVEDLSDHAQAHFTIVASANADPDRGRISVYSPLGIALLGARVGEVVTADLCGRPYRFLLIRCIPA
ncbi:GreA/GreB family elongation factor [Haliea sp.]|jgi:transcription elongation GreA/GreB family factor|uniref:GreA/GreB family elongation factor n=1 Tax=Haliea TaxID=475794 RepID=UPI000C58E7CA|nr:GreA/GreB family elongation factor [Haliea sp.]HAN67130.1 hypothetical protein [Halieaceae bacterium]MAD65414.1 hypothetical protein [Haliea sp.]MAY91289.1 hypothetical protein [Haliea sp.]MBK40778.1 hypothetical protein [Haliea sp.]MBP69174.1 hypothetical protein [Haliea sp.]|tara:strand:- start:7881 stop:8252 length:372 start_codon:yes stop_codon:yes gene_type:complete